MKIYFSFFFFVIISACSSDNNAELEPEHLVFPFKTETSIRFNVSLNTENPNIAGDIGENLLDKGLIILPKNYSSNGIPTKLVIYCHSGGGYVNDMVSESETDHYCKFLTSLGYAVLDMNGIPQELAVSLKIDRGRTVGNFVALRSYVAGYKHVTENFNIDKNGCYVFANSNGGLICMNLANLSNIPIISQAGICPVISIEQDLWNYKAGTISLAGGEFNSYQNRANIIRLYGMKNVNSQKELNNAEFEKSKVGVYDPFEFLMNKNTNDYSVPYKIFQTKDDLAVNFAITKKLVDAMRKLGDNMVLREFDTGGHTPEPQRGYVGVYSFQLKDYDLTPTVLEVAQWFEINSGYSVNYKK